MSTYKAPLTDIRFALFDVLQSDRQFARLGFDEASRDVADAVLEEGARFNETILTPLNAVGDTVGCKYDKDTGEVTPPPGFKDAYLRYVADGWAGLTGKPEFGGQGLPAVLGTAFKEMINSANLAWGNFPMLSHGAIEALLHQGQPWQQEVFLKPLVEGRWTGTMCLTEPHAGSDLGLLKTRATPNADGSHAIDGTKIFITAGDHDLTDNIVHLVLARLPDAPAGSKGISLFVVPKFKVDREGRIGARNTVRCGAIEHKMGIHGSATCVMNFDRAEGWLVGQPHKGLMAMFIMMNSARLGVGLQGLGLAERAFQNALRYARERLQSRAPSGAKQPDKPADPIIVQADVRRMLLTQKAFVEGGRLLAYHASSLLDVLDRSNDQPERTQADQLLGLLTPIVKGCLTEWANECTYHALQCFGGHGYIVEHGMEQLARDARITTLYEGTTGIQALDLMGRKTIQMRGAGLKIFIQMIDAFCKEQADTPALAEFIGPLADLARQWSELTVRIGEHAATDPEQIAAAAHDYLMYSGYVALAYWWARAVAAAEASTRSPAFKAGKRETARFYYTRILPRAHSHLTAIEAGPETLLRLAETDFDTNI